MSDPLEIFEATSVCPNCYAVSPTGSPRCTECGTFHSTSHLVERVPSPEDLRPHEAKAVDPSQYSINPDSEITVDSDADDIDDITTEWEGGSSDFSFIDEIDQRGESE